MGISLPSRLQRRRLARSPHAIARFSRGGAASADLGGTAPVSGGAKDPRHQLSGIRGNARGSARDNPLLIADSWYREWYYACYCTGKLSNIPGSSEGGIITRTDLRIRHGLP